MNGSDDGDDESAPTRLGEDVEVGRVREPSTEATTDIDTAPLDPVEAAEGRRRRWAHVPLVFLLSLLVGALQAAFGLQQYLRMRLGGYDIVIFDQAIRAYSMFRMPVSHFKDVTDGPFQVRPGYGHQFSILGDHFSPILAALAPLYWIWDDPRVLILAEAALFAAAVPIVWVFTRRALAPLGVGSWCAYAVGLAFGLCWMLGEATDVGFHEVAFIVPVAALLLERGQAASLGRCRWWQVVVVAVLLAMCKEEMGYVVAMYGVVIFFVHRKRLLGAAFLVGGIIEVQLVLDLWLPAFGARSGYYWYYGQLGPNMHAALWRLLTDPLYGAHVAITPAIKWQVMLSLLWPFMFLSLGSPLALLALPLLAERMFSDKPEHWGFSEHYNSMLAPIIVLAAVDGATRVLPLLARAWRAGRRSGAISRPTGASAVRVWAAFTVLAAIVSTVLFPIHRVFQPSQWQRDGYERAALAAVARIPKGSSVEADDNIAPYLTNGYDLMLFEKRPHDATYIIGQTVTARWPFDSPRVEAARLRSAVANGYHVVYERDGWELLRRDGS